MRISPEQIGKRESIETKSSKGSQKEDYPFTFHLRSLFDPSPVQLFATVLNNAIEEMQRGPAASVSN